MGRESQKNRNMMAVKIEYFYILYFLKVEQALDIRQSFGNMFFIIWILKSSRKTKLIVNQCFGQNIAIGRGYLFILKTSCIRLLLLFLVV